jgi:putative membrane protein
MRAHRTTVALLAAMALALPVGVSAQQSAPAKPSESKMDTKGGLAAGERKFVMDAARGNMAEVELGKLASEKASNDAVKQFGKRVADDHGKAQSELQDLAQKKGITLPTDLAAKDKKLRDRLAKLSGAEFDRTFVNEMVKDHRKDVGDFKREAGRAKDADIKAWADKTLPTLEDHLKQVQALQAQVKGGAAAAR